MKDVKNKLTNFRINALKNKNILNNPKSHLAVRWVSPAETIHIHGLKIKGGLIYFGRGLKSLNQHDIESSLLNPTLAVNFKSPNDDGKGIGYWPSYHQIDSKSRAAYINWLASDRSDPAIYIGYVFLYFYGLERRLILDSRRGLVSDDERNTLIQELKRLQKTYLINDSLNSYITNLLAHIWIISHIKNKKDPLDSKLLVYKKAFTCVFKYILAITVQKGRPINQSLAIIWIKYHPEIKLRSPAQRCEKVFDALFKIRFKESFADGLKLRANKTKLQLKYHPASGSLSSYPTIRLDLPDVTYLSATVKKIMGCAESCIDEIASYSRFVGKLGNRRSSLIALSLLPSDLVAKISHPALQDFITWIHTQVVKNNGLASVKSMLEYFGEDAPLKINKKEAEMLSRITEKVGFGIAPDIRYHDAKPSIDGSIVFFRKRQTKNFPASSRFKQIKVLLRLGSMLAAVDESIAIEELDILKKVIQEDDKLSKEEKDSLHAYMLWCLSSKANKVGLKAQLEELTEKDKHDIKGVLLDVALADGYLSPVEIKQLEKIYTSLGIDQSTLLSELHHLSSRSKDDPIKENKKSVALHKSNVKSAVFSLDQGLINHHEEQTNNIQAVLHSIFVEEIVGEANIVSLDSKGTTSLDVQHETLYKQLIRKESWMFDEVTALCKKLNLMVDGALEVINDWSFDCIDAPLIEVSDTILINLDVAEEISNL